LTFRIGFSSGMKDVKARRFPSGDQASPAGAVWRWVSWATSRVSSHMTWSWLVPSRSEMKAIFRPSGDQTGEESRQLPAVSSRTLFPSMSVIHRLLADRSLTLSTQVRLNRMLFPSGEMAGFPSDSMSMKVSSSRSLAFFSSAPQAAGSAKRAASPRTIGNARFLMASLLSYPAPMIYAATGTEVNIDHSRMLYPSQAGEDNRKESYIMG
jgi:hypothetical protein